MPRKPSPSEFFSKHAEHYASSKGHAHGSDLARLVELLAPRKTDVVLDVGTGTGFTALELAPRVKRVVGADITNEMLAQARRIAAERGIKNAVFEHADAMRLPYDAESFSIVTCRRASHHFASVDDFLGEARRVLKPGGRLGVDDMSPPEGAQDYWHDIEVLRDKTHVRALTELEWREKVEKAGLVVSSAEIIPEVQTYETWLSPLKVGGREDKAIQRAISNWPSAIRKELGVRRREARVVGLTKCRIVLVANRGPLK